VLLLSRDHAYSYLNKFVVAEVTTTIRNIAVQVPQQIACEGPALANCDNLRTVSRTWLIERISALRAPLG
jgi:hypothetical protein